MKRFLIMFVMLICGITFISAQNQSQSKQASIKFDKVTYNFGNFSEKNPVQKCVFTFTNTGSAPLVINQAYASCGCTVPAYTKVPVKPGEKGEIKVTYNGKGTFPGHFKKTITVRTNGEPELTRVYIEGVMEEAK